jgi:hypothetical protein
VIAVPISPPPRDEASHPPTASLIADDDDELALVGATRTRVCILCGHPLRIGQRMLRVHGSTIHARCT